MEKGFHLTYDKPCSPLIMYRFRSGSMACSNFTGIERVARLLHVTIHIPIVVDISDEFVELASICSDMMELGLVVSSVLTSVA